NGELIIDPQLEWVTYFGGILEDASGRVAVDGLGSIYIVGSTRSPDRIATIGSFQDTLSAPIDDALLVKFSGAGVREWATYYGGRYYDRFYDLSIQGDDIYVCGRTTSFGMATQGAHQEQLDTLLQAPDSLG